MAWLRQQSPLEPLINLVTRARRSRNRPSHNYKVEGLEFGQTWGNGSPEGLNDELFALFCDFSVESHSDGELRGAIAVGERKDIKRGNLGNTLGRFKQHFGYCLWKRLVGRLDASQTSGGQRGNDKASRYRSRYQPTRKNLELAPRDSWESRSSYRISETLSCAPTLRLTWSTHSMVDNAKCAR